MGIEPKVCVRCFTYNHSLYIEDALNGFCMQETTFPFMCAIVDDASTDGEQEVIRDYLQKHFTQVFVNLPTEDETDDYLRIIAQHKTNSNCFFAVLLLKYNHYSIKKPKLSSIVDLLKTVKYIATCEGDDYWTDSTKLQTQVDFLESHPEYSMCFHDVEIKAEKGRQWYDVFGKLEDRDYTGLENIMKWSVPTCSMVYRMDKTILVPKNPKFTMGDNVRVLTFSKYGKIRCIPKKMGVYRLTPTSWIGGQSDKVQRYKYISHYLGLIEEFEECRCQQMYDILENQYFQLLTILKHEGDKAEFERVKQEYLVYPGVTHWSFFQSYYIKSTIRSYIKTVMGEKIVSFIRKIIQN